MDVPEINRQLLSELEAMGFSLAAAKRALPYLANPSLEAAVNWIIDHENDTNIDQENVSNINQENVSNINQENDSNINQENASNINQENDSNINQENASNINQENDSNINQENASNINQIPLVPMDIDIKSSPSSPIREEIKIKAQELRDRARREKREEEKKVETEREKVQRRRKLRLPQENLAAIKPCTSVVQEKVTSISLGFSTKEECVSECLRSLKRKYKADNARVNRAFQTLLVYVGNVAKNPNVEKFRKIRLSNPSFQGRVGSLEGGIEFLELCGFERIERDGDEFLFLPQDKVDMTVMNSVGSVLKSAITNPYFGLFSKE